MLSSITDILIFALALIALIIVHEFGHFVVARLLKVEVEEFGLGFPPRILTLFEAWGTKFTLNALPLGGFVRPKGENDPNVPGGLAAASPGVRLGGLFCGPLMNLLVAVLLYAVVIMRIGMPDPDRLNVVQISGVSKDSPAAQAGLRYGDVITRLNGETVDDVDEAIAIIQANLGKPVAFTLQREGQPREVQVTPRLNPPEGEGAVGIYMGPPTKAVPVYMAIPAGAAAMGNYIQALVALPGRLASGEASPEEARPVGLRGMFDIYQQVQEEDSAMGTPPGTGVLALFAIISTSLGLLNLFPFPALDGGRILFTLPEIILRRRIPQQYENVINLVGFSILIILMIYINLQDFINPISK